MYYRAYNKKYQGRFTKITDFKIFGKVTLDHESCEQLQMVHRPNVLSRRGDADVSLNFWLITYLYHGRVCALNCIQWSAKENPVYWARPWNWLTEV